MNAFTRLDRRALLIYISLAVAVGFTDHRVRRFADFVVTNYVPAVVDGTAEAPGRYRVLAPFAIDALQAVTGAPDLIVFLVLRLLLIFGALVAMHVYLRRWYASETSVAGTALVAALLPLTFTNSWAHPDAMVELLLFTAGCWAIVAGRDWWFAVLVVLAALNRETSAFLLVLWAWQRLASDRSRAMIGRVSALGVAWFAMYAGLRWMRGLAHYEYWMLPTNIAALVPLPANFDPYVRVSGYMWLVLSIPLLTFAVAGARRTGWSSYRGRAFGVACFLLAVGFTISSVIESRIFTPLFPLLLPGALAGLGFAPETRGAEGDSKAR